MSQNMEAKEYNLLRNSGSVLEFLKELLPKQTFELSEIESC